MEHARWRCCCAQIMTCQEPHGGAFPNWSGRLPQQPVLLARAWARAVAKLMCLNRAVKGLAWGSMPIAVRCRLVCTKREARPSRPRSNAAVAVRSRSPPSLARAKSRASP
jgi:hypothetical protein